jgi:hypothetical protein
VAVSAQFVVLRTVPACPGRCDLKTQPSDNPTVKIKNINKLQEEGIKIV